MSKIRPIRRILAQAKQEEKRYDWLYAAELYKKALRQFLKQQDFLKASDIQERIGHCLHRASFQAKNQEEFKQKMRRTIEAYQKAYGFYENLEDAQKARMFRCEAVVKYLASWLASDPSEKRKLLDDCMELVGKALALLSKYGDMLEYGKTYNEFPLISSCRIFLEWDWQTLKSIAERGIEWGEKAVAALSELNDYEIAKAYLTLSSWLNDHGRFFFEEPEQRERTRLKIVKYLSDANCIFEKVSDAYLLGLSHLFLIENTDGEESIRHSEKTLEYGERTRDNFLIAWGLDYMAFHTFWKAVATEDPEKRRELAEKAKQFYDKAQHHYSIILFMSPRDGFIGAEHYWQLGSWETDPKKRLEFLEQSEKAGMEALKLAENSDMPIVIANVLHVVSKTLEARSRVEADPTEKRSRLEKALKFREKTIEICEQLTPFYYWNQGVMQNYLAGIRAQLADIEPDINTKRRLLEEAALSKEKCLNLCNEAIPYFEKLGDITAFAALQWYQDTYATLLTRLYDLTKEPRYLKKAIEISQKAIESASKLDMISIMAELYWKIAKAEGLLGEHLEAAENFKSASESYIRASEKIPQLKTFYEDYASYMEAWNQIEKAKYHHAEKRYGQAKEYYEKAANLHKSTERWSYLGPNYLAWAQLEAAEDTSRREQTEEAKDLFQQAAELFLEAEKFIEAKLKQIEAGDEKEMAGALAKASHKRREYCLGRVILEEAKVLDRQGDHVASSRKYGSAAAMFQEIAEDEPEHSRKELQPIVFLCQAWQKMMMAEAKASSTMYREAAELFKQAKEYTVDQPTSLLALANSSFCKALESGAEFEITGDKANYLATKNHMEAAEKYYLKAGFKTASEYAKATHILFDAYFYISKAETETEPTKKSQYYQIAEKLLQASAGSYAKAKHPEKKEEVQRFLESIKEKRQLAKSLTEVLHAPKTVSTTLSFATPTPTSEVSVGLERFEHANVQANLITHAREVRVGESFCLSVEFVNAGKEPALLTRVEDFVPQDFTVVKAPEIYRLEETCLNMKGKQIAPLKLVEAELVLQPSKKGIYQLKPTVHYLDELGQNKSLQLKSVEIKVEEVILADRVSTGTKELDSLLLGGIPEEYAVVLTGPPSDEKELIIKNFSEAGIREGQTSFYITTEADGIKNLLEKSGFYLFLCNPKPKIDVPDLPNVFKLRSKTDINNLNMALARESRGLQQVEATKRLCIEIVSDVLLRLGPEVTRRWLSELITDLTSKGFVMLAVMDPEMHPADQSKAVLNLFDGEISITQTGDSQECKKQIQVRKLRGQDYIKNPICLKT